ncbi:MAG TPA: hypothetical protein VHN55_10580 [Sphingomicrobium sp.]|nr:hypothetical protein [Sphingomicrobium sp.]
MKKARIAGLVLAAMALAAMTADRPAGFSFDPQPRWAEEPETEAVCEAMIKECAGQFESGSIDAAWAYAELYDADGYLVGLRSTRSTGCKPLDEHMLLGHRHFVTVFSKDGAPDLDSITVETAPGTDRNSVRLVKRGETSVSIGCS